MSLQERVEKALSLAERFVETQKELDKITAELNAIQLLMPIPNFSSLDDVENYLKEKSDYDKKRFALVDKQGELMSLIKTQKKYEEGSLLWLLDGVQELDIILTVDGYEFCIGDDGLTILELGKEAPLQHEYKSKEIIAAEEIINEAYKVYATINPLQAPNYSELVSIAQLIATIKLTESINRPSNDY